MRAARRCNFSRELKALYKIKGIKKCFKMFGVSQDAIYQAASGVYNLAWELDKAVEEAFKFHTQYITLRLWRLSKETVPGFEVPSQSCNHHISPIRNQVNTLYAMFNT